MLELRPRAPALDWLVLGLVEALGTASIFKRYALQRFLENDRLSVGLGYPDVIQVPPVILCYHSVPCHHIKYDPRSAPVFLPKLIRKEIVLVIRFISNNFHKKQKNNRNNENPREKYIYRYLAFNPEISIVREFLDDYITGIIFKHNKKIEYKTFFMKEIHNLFWSDYYNDAFLNILPRFIKTLMSQKSNEKHRDDKLYHLYVKFNNKDKKP
ncbi:hypothetical protein PAEPH01_0047 [Pancytospora epiphaga]|nr:hypothetical protein PAEPH01_0047 [Pancytospora epiphaga]